MQRGISVHVRAHTLRWAGTLTIAVWCSSASATSAEQRPEPSPVASESCSLCGDERLLSLLLDLATGSPEQRVLAIQQLETIPSPFALSPIAQVAVTDSAPAVRREALLALSRAQYLRGLGAMRAGTEDRYQSVRMAAIVALGAFPVEEARFELEAVVEDVEQSLLERRAALASLQRHGTRQAAAAISKLEKALRADGDPLAKEAAEAADAMSPCPTCVEPHNIRLVSDLLHHDARKRRRAFEKLDKAPLPGRIRAKLLERGLKDSDAKVRSSAVYTAVQGAASSVELLPLLATLATQPGDAAQRDAAMGVLLDNTQPEASAALAEIVGTAPAETSLRVIEALAKRTGRVAELALLDGVSHTDPRVAERTLAFLKHGTISEDLWTEAIDRALAHPDWKIVAIGLTRAQRSGGLAHAPALVRLVARKPPAELRTRAIDLIRSIDGGAATLARSDDPTLRRAAVELVPTASAQTVVALLQDADVETATRVVANAVERGLITPVLERLRNEPPGAGRDRFAQATLEAAREHETEENVGPQLPLVTWLLSYPDEAVSKGALKLLVSPPRPAPTLIVEAVTNALEQTAVSANAERMYRFLVKWNPPGLDAVQRRIARNPDVVAAVRHEALDAIIERDLPELEDTLRELRDDDDPKVRRRARKRLRGKDSPESARTRR